MNFITGHSFKDKKVILEMTFLNLFQKFIISYVSWILSEIRINSN